MQLLKVSAEAYYIEEAGKQYSMPRVTRVLDRFLPIPFSDEEAMARGSAVHKAVALLDDLYGSGLYWPSVDPSLVPYLMAWQDCKAEVIEQPHRCNLLVDIKTGVPHARHQLQTAAYKVALINPRRGMMPPRDALIEHRVVCFRHGYAGTLDRYYPASKVTPDDEAPRRLSPPGWDLSGEVARGRVRRSGVRGDGAGVALARKVF